MTKRVKFTNSTPKKKKEYQHNFSALNLSDYTKPELVETYGKNWIKFEDDEGNSYFKKLIDLSLTSPTNSRCIKGIADMVYGRGLEATDSEHKPQQFADMKAMLKSKDLKRITSDFKLLGQSASQITYNKTKTKILKITHFPMECLAAERAKDGVIKAWYYHPDWDNMKTGDKPKRIPSFGNGTKSQLNEIYVFKPYQAGFYYYATSDWHGCIQYCDLEAEVSNYHISNIQNGLQPSLFINFNNGVPNDEQRLLVEKKVNEKFGGSSNAGRAIIAFNEGKEEAATIDAIHLPDAHAQYQFLADEAREKIMLGHGIVSPILLGIKDNTGFGNNAEELRTASILMDNYVIRPLQQHILDGLNEILLFNNIELDLYFTTLQPIEFTELDNIATKIKREEETGEKLSAIELDDFNDEDGHDMLEQLEGLGEVIDDEWELVHQEEVKGEENFSIEEFKKQDKTILSRLKRTLASITNPKKARSSQDTDLYKVRYAYMPVRKSANSRDFCKKMEKFTENKIVFRKEDISMMSFRGVNKELGHKGRNYSLFKFKGGKYCKHYWELRVYRKKGSRISVKDAKKKGFVEPNNPSEIGVRPTDMPNNGAYPNK